MQSDEASRTEVLFDGSKSFWRERTALDILIVQHSSNNCLEVIAYNPENDLEAPRLYLNKSFVVTKFNTDDYEERLKLAKEPYLRRNVDFDVDKLKNCIDNEMATAWILERIIFHTNEQNETTMTFNEEGCGMVSSSATKDFTRAYPMHHFRKLYVQHACI